MSSCSVLIKRLVKYFLKAQIGYILESDQYITPVTFSGTEDGAGGLKKQRLTAIIRLFTSVAN